MREERSNEEQSKNTRNAFSRLCLKANPHSSLVPSLPLLPQSSRTEDWLCLLFPVFSCRTFSLANTVMLSLDPLSKAKETIMLGGGWGGVGGLVAPIRGVLFNGNTNNQQQKSKQDFLTLPP